MSPGCRSTDRRRCSKDCLTRIATHLCNLQDCDTKRNGLDMRIDVTSTKQHVSDNINVRDVRKHMAVPAQASSRCNDAVSTPSICAKAGKADCHSAKQKPTCHQIDACCDDDKTTLDTSDVLPDHDEPNTTVWQKECRTKSSCCSDGKNQVSTENTCRKETSSPVRMEFCCGGQVKSSVCKGDAVHESDSQHSEGKKVDSCSLNDGECTDECCAVNEASASDGACAVHLLSAFERYEAFIGLGQCLCRRVLKDLGFCCCSPSQKHPTCSSHNVPRARIPAVPTTQAQINQLCSKAEPAQHQPHRIDKTSIKVNDLEADAAMEHVVVSIAGMTCTGCAKKVVNVMNGIAGLSNPAVTFISETANFDVQTSITSSKEILARIENETGFKCSRVATGQQYLDVLMSTEALESYKNMLPRGVTGFETIKGRYRIIYDPHMIGARDILRPAMQLAPPMPEARVTEGQRHLIFMLWSFVFSAVLTVPVLVLNWSTNGIAHSVNGGVSLALATLVQLIAVPNFYVGAIKSLVYSRVVEMDMLVVISITAAYVYSVVAFALIEAHVELATKAFFETSTLLVTLVLLGRLLTAFARAKALAAVSVRSLQSDEAILVLPTSIQKIDARLLQYGDTLRVQPHSRVVTDGIVVSGQSAVDESMITGESVPVSKQPGSKVIAGSLNTSGLIDLRLTRLPGENSITDIARTMQDALRSKPKSQSLADKLAGYFVPVVVILGIIVFSIWIAVAIAIRKLNGGAAIGLSITYMIAVLAVSCPCALGLAVPMVLVIAGAVSARHGVVVRAADAFERGHRTTEVVFDKTGTLTQPDLHVVDQKAFDSNVSREQAMSLARSLVENSSHPVSRALQAHLPGDLLTLSKTQSVPGAGIEAWWCGSLIRAGNPYWLGVERNADVVELLAKSLTCFCISVDDELVLLFGLRSKLRDEACSVINGLQAQGIRCHLLSGDAPGIVSQIAGEVGIAKENTQSRCSPAEKQKYIQDLQARGTRVLFVGDGTNDAIAVAQADIGVQIGSASDVTEKVADVVLLGGLEGILTLLTISRRSWWLICFNFIWAGVYNVFAILLAAGAFVTFRLPPEYAGLGEIVSVTPVILASALLAIGRVQPFRD